MPELVVTNPATRYKIELSCVIFRDDPGAPRALLLQSLVGNEPLENPWVLPITIFKETNWPKPHRVQKGVAAYHNPFEKAVLEMIDKKTGMKEKDLSHKPIHIYKHIHFAFGGKRFPAPTLRLVFYVTADLRALVKLGKEPSMHRWVSDLESSSYSMDHYTKEDLFQAFLRKRFPHRF